MKTKIFFLITAVFLFGCSNKKTISIDGHNYTLFRVEQIHTNGISDVELWERKGVTNRYYTPSLTKKGMISIMK